MKKIRWIFLIFLLLACHKDPMLQQGFIDLEVFQKAVNEEMNQLTVKFSPTDVKLDQIEMLIIRISVDQIELENIVKTPTVKIDGDDDSIYKGRKIIETTWIPSIEISKDNLEFVKVYVK